MKRIQIHIHMTNRDLYLELKNKYPQIEVSLATSVKHEPYNVRFGRLPTKTDLL